MGRDRHRQGQGEREREKEKERRQLNGLKRALVRSKQLCCATWRKKAEEGAASVMEEERRPPEPNKNSRGTKKCVYCVPKERTIPLFFPHGASLTPSRQLSYHKPPPLCCFNSFFKYMITTIKVFIFWTCVSSRGMSCANRAHAYPHQSQSHM